MGDVIVIRRSVMEDIAKLHLFVRCLELSVSELSAQM